MARLFSPIVETIRGLRSYMRGVSWLRAHPKYLFYLFVPMFFALVLLVSGMGYFFSYEDVIFEWILFAEPESWWMLTVYYFCKVLVYIAVLTIGLVSFVLISNILACPVYEIVSVAIERDVSGAGVEEITLWESVKLIPEEIKKVGFILLVSIAVLLIPGLNVVATFVTAFLVGWDFYDYPLARRGWSFRERLSFVMSDFWAVLGLGLWLMIPFVQIFLLPMAIAGGTLLNLESIEREKQGRD